MAFRSDTQDPGIGEKFGRPTLRAINPDGTFNVQRRGRYHAHDAYQRLITMPTGQFVLLTLSALGLVILLFAWSYVLIGVEHLRGVEVGTPSQNFLHTLFFSVQTFTTVGYGAISPDGTAASVLASLESITGIIMAALTTALLYGRFSRPRARILFTRTAIISRRPDGTPTLQFRIANLSRSTLVELRALMLVQFTDAEGNRSYHDLPLERDSVYFFPLNWTIVHDITPDSPLHGLTAQDLAARCTELLILIKGYDDTFAQDVHARSSYRFDEIQWHRRYRRAYTIEDNGQIILELDKLDDTEAL
jgi:inward rectifier potassium channel